MQPFEKLYRSFKSAGERFEKGEISADHYAAIANNIEAIDPSQFRALLYNDVQDILDQEMVDVQDAIEKGRELNK